MSIKRALSRPIVTVCVSLIFSFSAQAANLTVGYQTGIDPSKVPQADGLYEKTIGQKIDWRRFNSGPEVVTAIASGDVQIGNLGSSPLAAAASRNLPIVAFIVSAQINAAEALVVRKGSGIDKPEDLIGKTIATPFVSNSHYSLLGALKHWGLDASKVKVVNLQPAEIAAAWKRGDIDGAHKDSWTADSVPVQKIAKLTGANAADVPELLTGSAFPDAKAQQTTALLDGGTAKAIGETAKFLKEQGKVETVLPDYSAYVRAKFVTE